MLQSSDLCSGCKRTIDGVTVRLRRIVTSESRYDKYCISCTTPSEAVKDVWYGYGSGTHIEENICNPETGQPIPFSSKRGKWEAMQKAGVVEAGDRVHGARHIEKNRGLKFIGLH